MTQHTLSRAVAFWAILHGGAEVCGADCECRGRQQRRFRREDAKNWKGGHAKDDNFT
jgi:hypothetical protein